MRKPFSTQSRLDCESIGSVPLNLNCRDEIVPVLAGLRHVYSQAALRDAILKLVAQDVNELSRSDRGREGLDYWHITVLAAVRLGCNLDYDKLQDLAEQHRALRQMMGIGDWQACIDFSWRRIRDNIALLKPQTIEAISHLMVDEAYRRQPEAVKKQRVDSFVVETDIHYPTESSLIVDGLRKTIEFCVRLYQGYEITGWRQHEHLLKRAQQIHRQISRIAVRKGANYRARLQKQYRQLLAHAEKILKRATQTCQTLEDSFSLDFTAIAIIAEIKVFQQRTRQVCETARRRVINGEQVPNEDKLFSIFEPHTQLYRRGKAGQPNQYGRLVLIVEDALGFITHHAVLPRDAQDQDVAVEHARTVQQRLDNRIEEMSFDRGFHSPENQIELAAIVAGVCLPKPGNKQSVEQLVSASVSFRQARQRHPGVESAIGALQSGNGLVRCRDVGEEGFERYVALAVLGRTLHTLGKLLIAQQAPQSAAAITHRLAA